jgi:hypothetical protein
VTTVPSGPPAGLPRPVKPKAKRPCRPAAKKGAKAKKHVCAKKTKPKPKPGRRKHRA